MIDTIGIQLLARDLDALGVPLPPAAQTVLEIRSAGFAAAQAAPVDQLAEDLLNGRLTPGNVGKRLLAAAQATTAKQAAHVILRDLERPLCRAFTGAIRADADRLLADLRAVFTPAAATMQRAGALIPVGASAEHVLAAGPEASDTWREMSQARATLDRVRAARFTLAHRLGVAQSAPECLMYLAAVDSLDDLLAVERLDAEWHSHDQELGGRWHLATAAGLTLHLADQPGVRANHVAVSRLRQAQDAQAAQEVRSAPSHPAMLGLPGAA